MIRIGLTGGIGMGKSTTAGLFAEHGIPVYAADTAVHRLYAGPLAAPIEAAFPGVVHHGVVDRAALGARVAGDPDALARLEAIVHPAVRAEEKRFLAEAEAAGARFAVLDIPLLFERAGGPQADVIVVASAPRDVQLDRLRARPGFDPDRLAALEARLLPEAEKRARADFVVDTGRGIEDARRQVSEIIAELADGRHGSPVSLWSRPS